MGLQGPRQDFSTYLSDLTHISKVTVAQRRSSQDIVEEHLQLLETSKKTLELVKDTTAVQDACKPLLFHPDLHVRDVFVDPGNSTKILGMIDWQSTAVEPAFVHANETPDFAEELMLDKTLDANISPETQEAQDHARRCSSTWAVMAYICPKLGNATTLDYELCHYLASVSSGYADDATSLRSLLADVSSRWEGFGFPGVCPYQPCEEEAKVFSLELDQVQSTQRLRMYLSILLRCETDGWVEQGRRDEVVPIYREQHAKFVESCIKSREEDETEEDAIEKADKLWPFDLR